VCSQNMAQGARQSVGSWAVRAAGWGQSPPILYRVARTLRHVLCIFADTQRVGEASSPWETPRRRADRTNQRPHKECHFSTDWRASRAMSCLCSSTRDSLATHRHAPSQPTSRQGLRGGRVTSWPARPSQVGCRAASLLPHGAAPAPCLVCSRQR
jgi:hypothetical protein